MSSWTRLCAFTALQVILLVGYTQPARAQPADGPVVRSTSQEPEIWFAGHRRLQASLTYDDSVLTLGEDTLLRWEESESELVLREVISAPDAYAISRVGDTTLVLSPTGFRPLQGDVLGDALPHHRTSSAHGACPDQRVVAYHGEQGLCLEGASGTYCRAVPGDAEPDAAVLLLCSESGAFHCATRNASGHVTALCRSFETGEELLAETEAPSGVRYAAYLDAAGEVGFRARSAAQTWDNPALPGFQQETRGSGAWSASLAYGPRLGDDGRVQPARPFDSMIARAVTRPDALPMIAWFPLAGGNAVITRNALHYWVGESLHRSVAVGELLAARLVDGAVIELVVLVEEPSGPRLRHGAWSPDAGLSFEEEVTGERARWAGHVFALAIARRGLVDAPGSELTQPYPARYAPYWDDFAQWVLMPQTVAGCASPGYVAELRGDSCDSSACALIRIDVGCVERVSRVPVWSPRGELAAEAVAMAVDGASRIWWLDPRGAVRSHRVPSTDAVGLAVYEVDDERALISDGATTYQTQRDRVAVTPVGRGIAFSERGWYWESSPGIWRNTTGRWVVATDEAFAEPQGCRGSDCGRLIVDGVVARELTSAQ